MPYGEIHRDNLETDLRDDIDNIQGDWTITVPADGEIPLYCAKRVHTIRQLYCHTDSGSCTIAFKINGELAEGLTADVSSEDSTVNVSPITISAGDKVRLVVSSNADAVNLYLRLARELD